MPRAKKIKVSFLKTNIENIVVHIFSIPAKDLLKIGYIAERGISDEKAAVQRIFSKHRVDDISKFVAGGGEFFGPFILNWTHATPFKISGGKIEIPLLSSAAQLLDGQHRFRGIQSSVEDGTSKGDMNVIVLMTKQLETKQAANIFTNINSKQQSVSKSLIYDLFTELGNDPNHNVNRSHDIAVELNTDSSSPYFDRIKFPGKPTRRGMIELATIIDSLKAHVDISGAFTKRNMKALETQKAAIINFFSAIRLAYEEKDLWESVAKNPFLGAAGFRAGIEVLTSSVLEICQAEKSIATKTFSRILNLNNKKLLTKDTTSFKTLGGKEQVKAVADFLSEGVQKNAPSETEYEL